MNNKNHHTYLYTDVPACMLDVPTAVPEHPADQLLQAQAAVERARNMVLDVPLPPMGSTSRVLVRGLLADAAERLRQAERALAEAAR
jgi:hypothetical protein